MTRRALTTLLEPGRHRLVTLDDARRPLPTLVERARLTLRTLIEGGASAPPPLLVSPPVVTGEIYLGELLACTSGVWLGASSYLYQWTRDGAAIPGATQPTYMVEALDLPAQVGCTVIALGTGGISAPAISNTLVSVWRPIMQVLGADGFFWSFKPRDTSFVPGVPVSSVLDVTGSQALVQAITSARPTQQADHVAFLGDDYLTGDQPEVYGIFARANPAPITSMIVLTTATSSSSQILYAASATGVTNRNYSVTAHGRAAGRPALARFAAATIPANKPMWMIDAAPTGSQATRVLDGVESVDGYIGGVDTADNFTLGGRRRVVAEGFITNGVKCFLASTRALTSSERAIIRATLDAQGVTTP